MTAPTPQPPGSGDVSETLGELERKLRQLETELASTGPRPDATPAPAPAPAAAVPPPPPPPAPAPAPPVPDAPRAATGMGDPDRLIAEARARLGGLSGQVDELLRFRESLQRTARELEDEYSRVLARIGAPPEALPDPVAPPAPPVAPETLRGPIAPPEPPAGLEDHPAFSPPPAGVYPPPLASPFVSPPPEPFAAPAPVPAPAPAPPTASLAQPPVAAFAQPPSPPFAPPLPGDPAAVAPAAYEPAALGTDPLAPAAPLPPGSPAVAASPVRTVPSPYDDAAFEGTIVLDAGPFTDISALSAFEQGLARVPGAEDVYVSGFEGNRALVELRLVAPVALVREMRGVLPGGFAVSEVAAGRLRIDVHPTFDPTHRS